MMNRGLTDGSLVSAELEREALNQITGIDPADIQHNETDVPEVPHLLPILPLMDTVVFPETVVPLAVGQERSIKLVDDALIRDKLVGLFTIREGGAEGASPERIETVGTMAVIHKMMRMPDGTLRILAQGLRRIRTLEYTETEPYLQAIVEELPDELHENKELKALTHNVASLFGRLLGFFPSFPEELQMALANIESPISLSHLVCSTLRIKTQEKQSLLAEASVAARLRSLTEILSRELEVFELGDKIQSEVKSQMDKSQREYFLRQQLKAINEELGEGEGEGSELDELKKRLGETELPDEARKQVDREMERLSRMSNMSAEWSVIHGYIDWILSLPWSVSTEDNLDIEAARQVLDDDHYDLEKIKDRILEFLAVRKLKNDMTGPILCFVGPPGVGKTSLGQSIARALGREFIRISVGGVRDESEVRGHRRTYVGAMPGTIIRALRDAGANNPVFMMDEVDKIGADYFRGDPASALLEVLDPEQNHAFRDHYLDIPFDLSKTLFITTANQIEPIPPALRDRMEIIRLSGYTEEEKVNIARKYLEPKQVAANGLTEGQVEIADDALLDVIKYYTREAGLRNLERTIGHLMRKMARRVASGEDGPFSITSAQIEDLLGRHIFMPETKRRTSMPGVATGLAWTEGGGDILFIESRSMPGTGKLTLTGQLGDVMKESATTALSLARSLAHDFDIDADFFQKNDIHIHIPAGAVPKDGPSAGVTLLTSLVSMLTGREVDESTAMTGEVTLTGQTLPVGGIKEKLLAARRAGITRIILPELNRREAEDDVPADLRSTLELVYVDRIERLLYLALGLELSSPGDVSSAASPSEAAAVASASDPAEVAGA